MTTRAGLAGFLTGILATMILFHPLAIALPAGSTRWLWIAISASAVTIIGGGMLSGKWSGSVQPLRCAALGGVSGGLAGIVVFCLLGAATAGMIGSNAYTSSSRETIVAIVNLTQKAILITFFAGICLGALGGWMAHPLHSHRTDVFDKSEPQMALNASITAVPASLIAAALSTVIFSRLADSIGDKTILDAALTTSLLLALISQFALMLVIPHEAHEAESRCGMDEIKMAAFVSIGTAPVLAALLLLVGTKLLLHPLVIATLLGSVMMSLKSLQDLLKLILPKRNSFPLPQGDLQKAEAKFFGTIADSPARRLVALCTGCGALMILPLHVTVFSVLINLATPRHLFLAQALTSTGLAAIFIFVLTTVYMLYLNLGRWFKRWRLSRSD